MADIHDALKTAIEAETRRATLARRQTISRPALNARLNATTIGYAPSPHHDEYGLPQSRDPFKAP